MTFRVGDMVEIKEGAPYSVTKPGSKWMFYYEIDNEHYMVGTPCINGYSPAQMVAFYGVKDERPHMRRRFEANVHIFTVGKEWCKPSGNNALFKKHLLQGDMWEEEK